MLKHSIIILIAFLFIAGPAPAQKANIPEIGMKAPSFTAKTTQGKINFPSDYGKKWKILFSHPKDFTPVCSSEILELAHAQQTFEELGTKIVIVSRDDVDQHNRWIEALEEIDYQNRGPVDIAYPLVDDYESGAAEAYGMIHSANSIEHNIRGVYIIDPDNVIRAMQFYPNNVGRNVQEIERLLVALQETDRKKHIATPANWSPGEDMIVQTLSEDDLKSVDESGSEFYKYSWFLMFQKN